jgi:hypothetical protein
MKPDFAEIKKKNIEKKEIGIIKYE